MCEEKLLETGWFQGTSWSVLAALTDGASAAVKLGGGNTKCVNNRGSLCGFLHVADYWPVSGSTEKYGCPSRMLYTTLALFPYVASSASVAVTWITEVPGGKKIHHNDLDQLFNTAENCLLDNWLSWCTFWWGVGSSSNHARAECDRSFLSFCITPSNLYPSATYTLTHDWFPPVIDTS